ncbi:polyunsaturated fatty acid lipoxygenase ALOX15B-like isoform X2 [Tachypleus tridentatus]|uniref:polyunsaturated fatty acid lipoxygenase ALOX15B-like isoform X2 n=1 Tax=Tachypleus tridentatus TaxID=6853 RepID=UPI003FCFF663
MSETRAKPLWDITVSTAENRTPDFSVISQYTCLCHGTDVKKSTRKLRIIVVTGDRFGAGTDANVWITVYDYQGSESAKIKLDNWGNDMEQGATDVYEMEVDQSFSRPARIKLWRDAYGLANSWFLDRVEICDSEGGVSYFPVHRWIAPFTNYLFYEFDSHLPQEDPNKQQREVELEEKRRDYQIAVYIEDGPAQCAELPSDEYFSHQYKLDIVISKTSLLIRSKLIDLRTPDKWTTLEDLKNIYQFCLEKPKCIDYWREDWWFGLQRLQGCNPVVIKLCTEIPLKFGVQSTLIEPFLEGMTLAEALAKKRIFIIDYWILKDVPCKDGRTLPAPIALFYMNKSNVLLPIAIQLFQRKGPNNPVFLCSDHQEVWLLAKMFFNNADASYHQSCTHLGFTHLLMEGVALCTHRNLSPSHPLFRLLAPHFRFLMAINARGLKFLVAPGGWVDKTMTIGCKGMFKIMKRGIRNWRMDRNGILPNELKSRGVNQPDILPNYPYRDDALAIYHAIHRYVSKIVNYYYDTPAKIQQDSELRQWRAELVKDRKNGGIGLLGVPGRFGMFRTVEEVVDTMTVIISTCSVGHSAANFQQYEEYSFPPNYPGMLVGEIPHDKVPRNIVSYLPNKDVTLDTMVITKLLSSGGTKPLGHFEVQYLFDPVSVRAAEEFRQELHEIHEQINRRCESQDFPYPWLDPSIVPNSISI